MQELKRLLFIFTKKQWKESHLAPIYHNIIRLFLVEKLVEIGSLFDHILPAWLTGCFSSTKTSILSL